MKIKTMSDAFLCLVIILGLSACGKDGHHNSKCDADASVTIEAAQVFHIEPAVGIDGGDHYVADLTASMQYYKSLVAMDSGNVLDKTKLSVKSSPEWPLDLDSFQVSWQNKSLKFAFNSSLEEKSYQFGTSVTPLPDILTRNVEKTYSVYLEKPLEMKVFTDLFYANFPDREKINVCSVSPQMHMQSNGDLSETVMIMKIQYRANFNKDLY